MTLALANPGIRTWALQTFYPKGNGNIVLTRPLVTWDALSLLAFHTDLSEKTVKQRFHSNKKLDQRIRWDRLFQACTIDHKNDIAFVATTLFGSFLGLVQIYRDKPGSKSAEIAFVVRDDVQGVGIGETLTIRTLEAARSRGITHVHAVTEPDNIAMIRAFLSWGFTIKRVDGEVEATIALVPLPD